jgi:hypothetical protein
MHREIKEIREGLQEVQKGQEVACEPYVMTPDLPDLPVDCPSRSS